MSDRELLDTVAGLAARFARENPADNRTEQSIDRLLWDELSGHGFTVAGVAEAAGGLGGTDADMADVISVLAEHDTDVPVFEHGWLAGWAANRVGLVLPEEPTSCSRGVIDVDRAAGIVTVSADDVAWLPGCDLLLVVDSAAAVLVDVGDLVIRPARDLAGRPCSRVERTTLPLSDKVVERGIAADEFAARHAHGRLHQIRSAARRLIDLTVEHARVRTQFGRPLADLQAVQQRLAVAGSETVMLDAGLVLCHDGRLTDVAAARLDAAHSVRLVLEHCHQVLGAMGVTREHPASGLALSMHAWLASTGPDADWQVLMLGDDPSRTVWEHITGAHHE